MSHETQLLERSASAPHAVLSSAAGKVLPNTGQPAPGQLITTAAGQQCLPLNMIRKPDGNLEFLGVTLGQVRNVRVSSCALQNLPRSFQESKSDVGKIGLSALSLSASLGHVESQTSRT